MDFHIHTTLAQRDPTLTVIASIQQDIWWSLCPASLGLSLLGLTSAGDSGLNALRGMLHPTSPDFRTVGMRSRGCGFMLRLQALLPPFLLASAGPFSFVSSVPISLLLDLWLAALIGKQMWRGTSRVGIGLELLWYIILSKPCVQQAAKRINNIITLYKCLAYQLDIDTAIYSPFLSNCNVWFNIVSTQEYSHIHAQVHVSIKLWLCVTNMCARVNSVWNVCVCPCVMHLRNAHNARHHQRTRWHILVHAWTPKAGRKIFGRRMHQRCNVVKSKKMNATKTPGKYRNQQTIVMPILTTISKHVQLL